MKPFNMNAEEDGGTGCFDGDTHVFRCNSRPIDGKEDAWLDGTPANGDDDDGGSTGDWLGPHLGVETQTACGDRGRRLGDEKEIDI